MEHGRDHDNRSLHIRPPRYKTVPDDAEGEGLVPRGSENGARTAPTRRAAEREAERHRLERECGRFAAGEDGLTNDVRSPELTREQLDAAAREADRFMRG